ncbi:MAG: DUF2793 domain-containing protein [Tabrizicola sp.]
MPDETTILSLPLILPAQAQKHVTHNEALVKLDLMVQLAVINRTLTSPPALPTIGDRHIVATGATGAWVGQAGRIALFTQAGWQFTQPLNGWQAYVMAESQMAFYNGLTWIALSDGPFTVGRLGVSATPDATNRLAVSSPATLLNHAGAGHQLKLNKAVAGDTASLLFQTGFSGRAEMGTAGTDDFSVKVSADGSSWSVALVSDAATGEVTLPKPVHLGGQASDPATPADGTLWLNTTTGEVKVRSAGATQVVGGGAGVSDGDKGDVTVSGSGASWTIDAGAVSLAKMADLATSTILGRASAGTGSPEALTAAQVRTVLNVANGATANAADAVLLARANHTGTQAASTITGLAAVATSGSASDLTAGVLPAARFDDTAHGARAGGTLHAVATGAAAGFLSAADKTKLDAITGTNTGDQTISLTGDVTGSGTGSFAATIAANAVGFTKLADIATDTLIGRDTAGTGDPEAITVTGGIEFSGTGAIRTSAFTGDVTKAAGGTALTVAANAVDNTKVADMAANTIKANATAATADPVDLAVGTNSVVGRVAGNIVAAQLVDAQVAAATLTNAKLANVATATLKGRATAGTGSPEDLTGTQATALLDLFGTAAKGLAPASGGGTTNFLRADGTWAAPPGGGGGSPGGSTGQVQYNSAGSFAGATNVQIEGNELRLSAVAGPTAPAAGGVKLYGGTLAGMQVPQFRGPSGNEWLLQPSLGFGQVSIFEPVSGTTVTNLGLSPTTVGTATSAALSVGSRRVRLRRIEYLVTTAATTAVAGWRSNASNYTVGGTNAWEGGFYAVMYAGPSTGVTNASHRFFMGMLSNAAAPTDVNPSTLLRMVGIGYDAADTQVQVMSNDATGAATKIALGASFPKPNADRSFTYRLELYSPPGSTQSVSYRATYLETGAVAEGTLTADLPGTSDLLQPYTYVSVGGVSSVVGMALGKILIGTEY